MCFHASILQRSVLKPLAPEGMCLIHDGERLAQETFVCEGQRRGHSHVLAEAVRVTAREGTANMSASHDWTDWRLKPEGPAAENGKLIVAEQSARSRHRRAPGSGTSRQTAA